ncbi:glycosyltransferase involved in cell wall biosynthesis [Flavobacterium nitrogenifigens]|uniref:Glycosyltransferase involved in cell wall biosynthesis n=2 Tax=Flavobacterium TaxID=237 RepID=A0A7W7N9A4_9FLAO|nr:MULTISPECIES: glycosyltransferase family 2 protein [Flavobacterium]MBB4803269.1 glycosyltransferase involved in cell wall biosynthesis [Flavobacterium nitrogenifigens]MBB6388227.1 glycosyltransferase involved in cell wall biosynthesis [Flavobacterium notoginsengisoli]
MVSSEKQLLSALIITRNEEQNIQSVLENLIFANEIIVVDSFSSDRTFEIASSFKNVKAVQHSFENFASQRNYAISLASNSWILFIDADERVTPNLKNEIETVINEENKAVAYFMHRTFMFKNKRLRFSGWQTDKIIRLFKKENAFYNHEKIVHEKLIIDGEARKLKNKLIHFSYSTFDDYKEKMIFYGKLKAQEELAKNTKPNLFHFYIRPAYQFLNQFVIRLGFLDGRKGLTICYLNALSVSVRFQELKKIRISKQL